MTDCTMSRCVWALVDQLTEHMGINSCEDAKEWPFHMMEETSHEYFTRMLRTLWASWTTRRKAIHKGEYQSPMTVHGFVQRMMADLEMVRETPRNSILV